MRGDALGRAMRNVGTSGRGKQPAAYTRSM